MADRREYYTADEVRAAEADLFTRVPDGMPMRRAAYGLAAVVIDELLAVTGSVTGSRVGLLVGSGDNGGDALWAGVFLRKRGVGVQAILLDPERAHSAALAAFRRAGGRVVDAFDDVDLVVDGIVGISGRGPLRPAAAEIVAAIDVPIISADLPSGVDPNTGAVDGPAVRADVTVAFGAYKPCHVLAAPYCGRTILVPIGLDLPEAGLAQLDPWAIGAQWPVPGPHDDKYTQGVVGVCAGSAQYPGAGVLCTGAAVTATSGMVRYVGSDDQVLARFPEAVASATIARTGRVQAWVFGPGAGTGQAARNRLAELLDTDLPVLVDADGLTVVAAEPGLVRNRKAPTVLTPHAGEFERLTGHAPGTDRVASTRALADEWGVTVLLKGRATIIATPGEATLVNEAGGDWAATPGSGDVLSGIIGALLAAGQSPSWACASGARAHSLAANLAAYDGQPAAAPISAMALLDHLRAAIRVLRELAGE
ncbi:bifunctional ADP-dependent NAD(P)H-hydrate dehydratase/NAD(P)H-hydrate epimerase [Nocardia camponoti]|uniref:ADP-dependent (S)-NAD(P)H-hydrate dehydratase n=1 Tax=Nocardia camponoti TaxID=1616106 RepID=A0A917VAQ1_9NOCA|nr:bifunctional ADP-dependent NAD(P)H-hydrate dehydratase/NAD(P)H-hydrate epimerase [Nocardia camponoti]GGK57001.1 bifunctional NAD(P)H-hydrate repair enzyme [Nocardia camponoti]